MGLFNNRQQQDGKEIVPVWFMRQAGRYHSHYQNIKKKSNFMEMCKDPKLAQEVTHGPLDEFNFDAAILFSDLLFPLEHLGMGLTYAPGPKLGFTLEQTEDLKKLSPLAPAEEFYAFQGEACALLRKSMPEYKTLLGFVGSPWTLYTYACQGSHAGNLTPSKNGFYDGRFAGFCELLLPNLLTEMRVQAENGADAICLFDTAVGELTKDDFCEFVLPKIKEVTEKFKSEYPDKKIVYYSKLTHIDYLEMIDDKNIDVLGIDWRVNIEDALNTLSDRYYIQGNLDPSHLHLPWEQLEKKWMALWEKVEKTGKANRWICGLGHGVLQHTPEENVKNSVALIHERFRY